MRKVLSIIVNTIVVIGVLSALIAAVGSAIAKEPVLLTVIRSNSMYPVWERGDMVMIQNLKENDHVQIGDIVFFKTENDALSDKGWIAHRVLEGDATQGYITKGDANEYTDQATNGVGPIKRSYIAAKSITIGGTPIVLPKIGYLSLWAEQFQETPYILPAISVLIALIIGFVELKVSSKAKKKNKGIEPQLIYIIGGLTISIMIGATMLSSSQKIILNYEVSDQKEGLILGSPIGIIKVGDEITRSLSELKNGAFFPLIGTLTSDDEQIKLSHYLLKLSKGESIETNFHLKAEKVGKYEATIQVGLFYPFLPSSWIYFLAEKSYWLALATVSLIPGLPLVIYPFVDRKMRTRLLMVIRKKKNKLLRSLPI